MTKADFYIGQGKKANWIGSIYSDGYPQSIPLDILICINPILYEELVVDFIKSKNGVVRSEGGKWPWAWGDSRTTDYAYIFEPLIDKVLASQCGGPLFDPIVIAQGEDLMNAYVGFEPPSFPIMFKGKEKEEWIKRYQFYTEIMGNTQTGEISH